MSFSLPHDANKVNSTAIALNTRSILYGAPPAGPKLIFITDKL